MKLFDPTTRCRMSRSPAPDWSKSGCWWSTGLESWGPDTAWSRCAYSAAAHGDEGWSPAWSWSSPPCFLSWKIPHIEASVSSDEWSLPVVHFLHICRRCMWEHLTKIIFSKTGSCSNELSWGMKFYSIKQYVLQHQTVRFSVWSKLMLRFCISEWLPGCELCVILAEQIIFVIDRSQCISCTKHLIQVSWHQATQQIKIINHFIINHIELQAMSNTIHEHSVHSQQQTTCKVTLAFGEMVHSLKYPQLNHVSTKATHTRSFP